MVPAAVAFVGLVLGSTASAVEVDPSFEVRGALGGSLDDLMLSNHLGAVVFFLNAGCLLVFGALAIVAQRMHARGPQRAPTQAYFAR